MIKKIAGDKRELISLVVLVLIGFAALAVARVAGNKNASSDVRSHAAASEAPALPGFGKALTIKSNRGGVVVTASQDLDMVNSKKANFTLEAWVQPFSVGGTSYIVSKEGPKPGYALVLDGGHLEFRIHLLSSSSYVSPEITPVLRSTMALKPNQWYHVAIMRHLGNFYLLVNGQMAAKPLFVKGWEFYYEQPDRDLIIGATNWPGWKNSKEHGYRPFFDNNFIGQIDELRVSDTLRTELTNNPPTHPYKPDAHTVALWHFDNDLRDVSGHNHDGWPEIYFTDSNIAYQPPVVSPQPSPTPVVSKKLTAPKNVRAICFGFGNNKPVEITWSLESQQAKQIFAIARRRWGVKDWEIIQKVANASVFEDYRPHQHGGYDYQVRACEDIDCRVYKASKIAKTYCSYSAPEPPAAGVWRFWGRVTTAPNSQPLSGVKVQLYGSNLLGERGRLLASKITGQDGRYYLYYRGQGYRYFWVLNKGKPGYRIIKASVGRGGQVANIWDTVRFVMARAGFYADNDFVLQAR